MNPGRLRSSLRDDGEGRRLATVFDAYVCKKLLLQIVTIDAAVDSGGRRPSRTNATGTEVEEATGTPDIPGTLRKPARPADRDRRQTAVPRSPIERGNGTIAPA